MKYIKNFEDVVIPDFRRNQTPVMSRNMEEIMKNYFDGALWTIKAEKLCDEYLSIYNFTEYLTQKSKNRSREEIEWFFEKAGKILDSVKDYVIGHDLWFSRNYNTGFSNRSYYDEDEKIILQELSKQLNVVHIDIIKNNDNFIIDLISNDNYKNFDIDEFKKKLEFDKNIKNFNL